VASEYIARVARSQVTNDGHCRAAGKPARPAVMWVNPPRKPAAAPG